MVTFNSSMIMVNEEDGSFLVCIDIVRGIIPVGQTIPIEYTTFHNGQSKYVLGSGQTLLYNLMVFFQSL